MKVIALLLVGVALFGCGSQKSLTSNLVNAQEANALAPLPDGGIRYGEFRSGDIYDLVKSDVRKLTHVDVASGGEKGLLGLAIDEKDPTNLRTFATWINTNNVLVVGQVSPGPTRIIWQGPIVTNTRISGRTAITPSGRVLVAIGDLEEPSKISDPNSYNGKLITLDPDRGSDQVPNIISKNWNNPTGVAYGPGDILWVADTGPATNPEDIVARAGNEGPSTGSITSLGRDKHATGITRYGDQELAVCLRNTKELQRLFVKDAKTIAGRTMATDCVNGVTELSDGRLAYSSNTEIRATVQ